MMFDKHKIFIYVLPQKAETIICCRNHLADVKILSIALFVKMFPIQQKGI